MKKVLRNPKRMKFDPEVDTGLDPGGRVELEFVRDLVRGADALNIGCWTGSFERRLAEVEPGCMTSVDIEPRALEVARRNVPCGEFLEASILDLPFADQSFDLVTLWAVIEHIPVGTEDLALAEIARVLRHGGSLALSTPSAHLMSRLFDPAYLVAGHRHYSVADLSTRLEKAGFSVSEVAILGGWYGILDVFVFYIWKWFFRRRPPAWEWLASRRERDEERKGFNAVYVLAQRA
ncbi:MAG: class I SAM-dependent methyltransferase [Candidatus Geothermincolia bacterium]